MACCVGLVAAYRHEPTMATKEETDHQKLVLDIYVTPLTFSTVETVKTAAKEWSFDKYKETYEKKEVVEKFVKLYDHGLVPYSDPFVPTDPKMIQQAIALYNVLYYAKDFETFFKVSSWARQNINAELFYYVYSTVISQRSDTYKLWVPPTYELFPYYFLPVETMRKVNFLEMQNGVTVSKDIQNYYGVEQENNDYTVYSNYSGWYTNVNEEQKLTYFTEDRYLNNYYNYVTTMFPFWIQRKSYYFHAGQDIVDESKVAEFMYTYYQMAIARYYNERLSNGLGEIPRFNWEGTLKTGYYPSLDNFNGIPLMTRPNYYNLHNAQFSDDINKLTDFESYIRQGIQQGFLETKEGTIQDLRTPKGFFQLLKLFFKTEVSSNTFDYYTAFARSVLGLSKYTYIGKHIPSVLELPYTAVRDPMFYQFYNRLVHFVFMYQQYLTPYTVQELTFKGVEVKDVKVDKLVTYFDYSDIPVAGKYLTKNEKLQISVRQPKLNHSPFVIKFDIHSEKPVDAVIKVFFGPKYDSHNREININKNRQNFYLLDKFAHKLNVGENIIPRKSQDFLYYNKLENSLPTTYEKVLQAAAGKGQSYINHLHMFPEHMILPKGTKGGFPYQIFVIVYPFVESTDVFNIIDLDGKLTKDSVNLLYPFDRPIDASHFVQTNIYTKDVVVYHYGDDNVYTYGTPYHYHGDWYGKDLKKNQSFKE